MSPYEKNIIRVILHYRKIHSRDKNLRKRHWRMMAGEILELFHPTERTADGVIQYVCGFSGITVGQLKSNSRKRELSEPRQLICYILRKTTKLSTVQIGEIINRDHSDVSTSTKAVANLIETNSAYRDKYLPIFLAYNLQSKPNA